MLIVSCLIRGSPPLTRGIRWKILSTMSQNRITPAYAGNTPSLRDPQGAHRDHPRLRGEYQISLRWQTARPGSPPLTRGIQFASSRAVNAYGITPAYAGNTDFPSLFKSSAGDHPRLRGEYDLKEHVGKSCQGSPPLTRGIPLAFISDGESAGITPAYAGNTGSQEYPRSHVRDHPRLRGEYMRIPSLKRSRKGSPPLTRGIPWRNSGASMGTGITPAYAGNTLKESLIYSIFPLSATKFHLVSHTLEMS